MGVFPLRPSGRLSFAEFLLQWPCEVELPTGLPDRAFIDAAYHVILLRAPEDAELWRAIARANSLRFDGEGYWEAMLKAVELTSDSVLLGELYAETGQVDKARENLALLKKLCPVGCEEMFDLEEAIASAKVN